MESVLRPRDDEAQGTIRRSVPPIDAESVSEEARRRRSRTFSNNAGSLQRSCSEGRLVQAGHDNGSSIVGGMRSSPGTSWRGSMMNSGPGRAAGRTGALSPAGPARASPHRHRAAPARPGGTGRLRSEGLPWIRVVPSRLPAMVRILPSSSGRSPAAAPVQPRGCLDPHGRQVVAGEPRGSAARRRG